VVLPKDFITSKLEGVYVCRKWRPNASLGRYTLGSRKVPQASTQTFPEADVGRAAHEKCKVLKIEQVDHRLCPNDMLNLFA
jgi:hypothetical protein